MDYKIAERLQQYRKQNGYSQEELADKLNVSRQAVSKWERGEASPDTDNLIALAKLYNVTIDDLINKDVDITTKRVATEQKEKVLIIETKDEGSTKNGKGEEDDEDKQLTKKQKHVISIVSSSAAIITTLIYFIIGMCTNIWHPTWIVFMLIPTVITLTDAIIKKNATHFAYPVLVAAVYVLVGICTNLWHPMWIIFLTIPVYYIITDTIYKNK